MGEERANSGFIPCLWCAGPIPRAQALDAMQACGLPLYCSDDCRSDLERSLVKRIYDASEAAAEQAGYADYPEFEAAVRANFSARLRTATSFPSERGVISTRVDRALEELAVNLLK